ncbi:hypothetical protein GCM10010353_59750 [Streptomyces chryseus]|nr:hypothetical protein GCM10010353_59750 [Streptomyces chryseus]
MSVLHDGSAVDVLRGAADAAAVRRLMELPANDVVDLAVAEAAGDPLVQLVSAVLRDRFVDRYTAARALGERLSG